MRSVFSLAVSLAALASTVAMFYYNTTLGLIQTAVYLVLIVLSLVVHLMKAHKLSIIMKKASKYFESPGASKAFPLPFLIAEADGTVLWYNSIFTERVLSGTTLRSGNISELVGITSVSAMCTSENGTDITFNEKKYTVYADTMDADEGSFCFFFVDNTDLKNTAEEYFNAKPVILQLKIDNLDEVYQNYKNSECEVISGELEHILEAWAADYPCVFRRVGSGKYFLVMEERGLAEIYENKFDILKKIRDYKYGNKAVEITLSIGVGRGKTLAECDENSKKALEMSQSRGGDQATVNTDGALEFFGGTISGPSKRTKIKARIIANAFYDHVMDSDAVFAVGHCFSDLDSVGAAVGIYSIAKSLGKSAYIIVDSEKSMAKTLIEALNEKEMMGAFIDGNIAKKLVDESSLLVIVDTHREESIDYPEVFKLFENKVVIDHHRRTANYIDNAVLYYDEPSASSASEMVTELVEYMPEKVELHPLCAEALLSGIMLDTRNFVISTGARTFEAAAFLKSTGANTVSVRQLLANSIENYKQKNNIISTAVTYKNCAVAVATEQAPEMRIIASQVANELLDIAGIKSSYVLFEENGQINISARSLGEMNVQVVMEALGGGGHLTMAATQLSGITMGDAVVKLEDAINKFLEE